MQKIKNKIPVKTCVRGSRQFQRRVSNSLNSHFIIFFFAGPGQFTKRLLIISADAKGKDSMILLRPKRPRTSIPATCCFKVWGRT